MKRKSERKLNSINHTIRYFYDGNQISELSVHLTIKYFTSNSLFFTYKQKKRKNNKKLL